MKTAIAQIASYAATFFAISFILALCLGLGGCVTNKQYSKTGATAADLQQAKLQCEFEAAKSDVDVMHTTWQSELRQLSLIDLCLRSKGYTS